MNTIKTLLYPFSTDSQYFDGYSWSVSLAARLHIPLHLLAMVPGNRDSDRDNIIHCSLLEAHGYFMEHYLQGQWKRPDTKRISIPDLGDALLAHVNHEPGALIILDQSFCERNGPVFKKLIKGPMGVIVLPVRKRRRTLTHPIADPFHEDLLKSAFYHVPERLYTDLSKDTSGFNYLRQLFQKSSRGRW